MFIVLSKGIFKNKHHITWPKNPFYLFIYFDFLIKKKSPIKNYGVSSILIFIFKKKIINERIRYRKDMEEINKEKIILKKGD